MPSAPKEQFELWLDCRERSSGKGDSFDAFVPQEEGQSPVTELLKHVLVGLKEKLDKIGVTAPGGRHVQGVLVDESTMNQAVEDLKGLPIAVYTATNDVEGIKLPFGAYFVCDGEMMPVGTMSLPPDYMAISSAIKPLLEVRTVVALDEVQAAEKEARARNASSPSARLRELMSDERDIKSQHALKGQLLAKVMPADPIVWARAIMQRAKETGRSITYQLKSDRAKKEAPSAP